MEFAPLLIPPWGIINALLWGAVWGSFANVVIYRLPAGKSVVWPGSMCGSCGHALSAIDNIPIFSYLFLRGRCRHCGASYSARYAIVEALMATLSLLFYLRSPLASGQVSLLELSRFGLHFSFAFLLLAISLIDWDTFIVPDVLIIPGIASLLLWGQGARHLPLEEALMGLVLGYGIFWTTTMAYRVIKKSEGLGLGDAKLLGAIGLMTGPLGIAPVIFLASLMGLLFAGVATLCKITWPNPLPYKGITDDEEYAEFLDPKSREWRLKPIPFGPFLSLSAVIFLLLKPAILSLLTTWFTL